MATNDYGFFFNSINGDRVYDADSFSTWLRKFFTSGVFEGELAVTAAEGMTVEVGSGYANVDGKVRFFNSPQTIALSPANSTYPRIDTIAVERNDVSREIVLKYITGQYSGNTPSPAERKWGNGVYQLVLAQIYVGAGATSIGQANISDTRPDSSLCGYVVGTVKEINLSQILAQSQEQFAEWFDRMKGQLSDDAAGNLQLEIDSINDVLYDPVTGGPHLSGLMTVDGSARIVQDLSTPIVNAGIVNATSGVYIGNDRGFYTKNTSGTPVKLLQLNSDDVCVVGHDSYDTNILGKTITVNGTALSVGAGSVLSFDGIYTGYITGGVQVVAFFIPTSKVLSGTPSCPALHITIRHADGGYPYARSGSGGGTYTPLADTPVLSGGSPVRAGEITSVTCSIRSDGLLVRINWGYPLARTSGNATAVTNNVPVVVDATGTIAFA